MSDQAISLSVKVDGIPDAQRGLAELGKSLAETIAALNSGGTASSEGSKPEGAPAGTPSVSNGMGEYSSPTTSTGKGGPLDIAENLLRPGANPSGTPPPPPAPDPHATGYAAPFTGGISNGQTSVSSGPMNVVIVGSTVPLGNSGSGSNSGGYGGPGGSSGLGGSGNAPNAPAAPAAPGGGGAGGGGGAPGSPYAGGFNPHQGGGGIVPTGGAAGAGGLQGLLATIAANPSVSGLAQTALSGLGLTGAAGALGTAGLAFGVARAVAEPVREGLDIFYSGNAPRYQMQTDFATRTIRGGYASDLERRDAEDIASRQGDLNESRAINSSGFGRVANFLSLGGYDLYQKWHTEPALERDIAEKQAKMDADLQINRISGLAMAPIGDMTGPNLNVTTAEAGDASLFGVGGVRGLTNSDSASVIQRDGQRFDQGAIQSALKTIYQSGSALGQGNMFGDLSKGLDPLNQAGNAANVAISNGDLGALASLQPLLGGKYQDFYKAAVASRDNLTSQQIDQANLSGLASQTSLLQATGSGYRDVSASVEAQAAGTDAYKQTLEYQRRLETNTIKQAQLDAQIKAMDAQKAGLEQQAQIQIFSGRGTENQAFSTYASNVMYRAEAGGTAEAVDTAFGIQAKAGMRDYRLLEDESNSPVISPEQRKLLRQQAEAKRLEATLGVERSQSSFDYSIVQAKIGVGAATADAAALHASMYGGYEEQQAAQFAQANVTGARLAAVTARLADPDAHLSAGDRLGLSQEQIRLTADFANALETATRSALGLHVATDAMRADFVATGNTIRMSYFGAGGAAAGALQSTDIAANRTTLTSAQDNFAHYDALVKSGKMSPNSRAYLDSKSGLQQAQGTLYGSEDALSSLPFSLADRTAKMDADFAIQVSSRGILPMGNMRGNIQNSMDAVGREIRDLGKNETRELAEANKDTYTSEKDKADRLASIRFNFKQQQYGLDGQLVDLQTQLQSGWQDRLISSVVNMPGRASFVSAAFTKAEASHFVNNMGDLDNGSMGSSSVGARDATMFRYPRLLSNGLGQTNHAAGFVDTAVAQAGGMPGNMMPGTVPPPAGGVLRAGNANKLEITVHNDSSVSVKQGARTTTLKPGSSATVIHDISNGALAMNGSQSAKSTSHQ